MRKGTTPKKPIADAINVEVWGGFRRELVYFFLCRKKVNNVTTALTVAF